MDHPQFMCDGTTPYKVTNRAAGIQCRNEEGSCKHGTCMCDAAFIDELARKSLKTDEIRQNPL